MNFRLIRATKKLIRKQQVELEELQKRLNEMLEKGANNSDLVFEITEEMPIKKSDKEMESNDIRKVVMKAISEEEEKRLKQ